MAAAVAANERLAHRPAAIQARAELALARLRRGRKEEAAPARALLQQALAAAESTGMSGLAARWREARAHAEAPRAPAERGVARMDLVQAGRWRVAYEGEVATVGDRSGMRYLAQLVAAPGEPFPALALVAQGSAPAEVARAEAVMDRRALAEVRERIRAIREQPEMGPADEAELATLTQELTRAMGLGGRTRSFADAQERARTAVQKAIKRAIEAIALANPAVGRHLSERIETGAVCCYRP